jgi:hypothetical protein
MGGTIGRMHLFLWSVSFLLEIKALSPAERPTWTKDGDKICFHHKEKQWQIF